MVLLSHFLCKFVKANYSLYKEHPNRKQTETFYPMHFLLPLHDYPFPCHIFSNTEILCSVISLFYKTAKAWTWKLHKKMPLLPLKKNKSNKISKGPLLYWWPIHLFVYISALVQFQSQQTGRYKTQINYANICRQKLCLQ